MTIDLKDTSSIKELHLLFQQRLEFPDFYGKNWAAFWDAITGLVDMPDCLILKGWSDFSSSFPADSKVLYQIINRYNSETRRKIKIE